MGLLTALAVVATCAGLCMLPTVLVVLAARRPWPGQVRLLLAAHHAQLASGVVGVSMMEATVVGLAAGERPLWVMVRTPARAPERLQLSDTIGPRDVRALRYWLAEAIPVVMVQDQSDVIEVHGPSGVVRARPSLVAGRAG
jgi:hypothetical protein